jgi:hypothetical protein
MAEKIPLPKLYKGKDSKAHPFPFLIAMQTLKFIQGSVFYFTLMDEAAGQFFRQENAYEKIKSLFSSYAYSDKTWETSWSCFQEYLTIFPNQIMQVSLISMKSYWDWYVSQLGKFIIFAVKNESNQSADQDKVKGLSKIGFKDITSQFGILRKVTGLSFNITQTTLDSLSELVLVRNLGIHNQWEVDETYLKWTKNGKWRKGEIRTFTKEELYNWHQSLIEAINKTSQPIAEKYVKVPEFMPYS